MFLKRILSDDPAMKRKRAEGADLNDEECKDVQNTCPQRSNSFAEIHFAVHQLEK